MVIDGYVFDQFAVSQDHIIVLNETTHYMRCNYTYVIEPQHYNLVIATSGYIGVEIEIIVDGDTDHETIYDKWFYMDFGHLTLLEPRSQIVKVLVPTTGILYCATAIFMLPFVDRRKLQWW